MYMIFKLVVAFASIQSLLACPGSVRKSNLRPEEIEEFHRRLSNIAGSPIISTKPGQSPVCKLTSPFIVSEAGIREVYAGVRADFYAIIDDITGNAAFTLERKMFEVSSLLGNALRLVFHDAGEVDIRTRDLFGSDGCLSASGPNSGLQESITPAMTVIETLWQKYCDKISRADFWVLFGKIAAESGLPTGRFATFTGAAAVIAPNQNATPYLNIPFQYGRRDNKLCNAGQDRLPAHQPGLSEFVKTFVNQMGMTVRDGVTLSGAHTVGHVHTQFSGFGHGDSLAVLQENPTTNAWDESPWVFDNVYYDSLALEFWLNNDASSNIIPVPPATTPAPNTGANFWAVQVAPGTPQPIPICADLLTCGVALSNDQSVELIFCDLPSAGGLVRYTTPLLNPVYADLPMNPSDPTNTCNCASFFAVPPNPSPANCNMGPHPKTIMLNADMVQNFPISAPGNSGKGVIGELCAPFVVSPLATGLPTTGLTFPQPVIDPNNLVNRGGFGCVSNDLGHLVAGNKQTFKSSNLPKDPTNSGVSLWAQVQSYMTLPIDGSCLNGISTFDPAATTYGGTVVTPLVGNEYIGMNYLSSPARPDNTCVEATAPQGVGRDIFFRDFEKAWVKMVTVGYAIDYVQTGPSKKLGNLKSIVLGTKGGSSTCDVGALCTVV